MEPEEDFGEMYEGQKGEEDSQEEANLEDVLEVEKEDEEEDQCRDTFIERFK
jgi:hypothetical protein